MAGSKIYAELGRRIAARRKARVMTQAALAERIGISRAAIANIEAGRQTLTLGQIYDLAGALGFSRITELVPAQVPKPQHSILPGADEFSPTQITQLENIVFSAVSAARSRKAP